MMMIRMKKIKVVLFQSDWSIHTKFILSYILISYYIFSLYIWTNDDDKDVGNLKLYCSNQIEVYKPTCHQLPSNCQSKLSRKTLSSSSPWWWFFLSNRCLYFSLNYVLNNNTETFLLGTGANQVYSTLCYAKRAPQFREKYYWVTTLCIVET